MAQPPQPPKPAGRPTFVATRSEVIVAVTVTDDKGHIISDLKRSDFKLLDEGRVQKISSFARDTETSRQPTVIGFLVDTGAANRTHWDKFKEATKELIWRLLPNDPNYTGYLISYADHERLETDTTSDPDKLTDQVDRLQPAGGAALYNAIRMACADRRLAPGEPYRTRRVLIVIGDGHDSASQYSLDQVAELAQRDQITVYGMSTLAFGASSDSSKDLERLAKATGGHVEYPLSNPYSNVPGYLSQPSDQGNYALSVGSGGYSAAIATAVNNSVESLYHEITGQYILRYTPEIDRATAYKEIRKIEVRISGLPKSRLVNVRARESYYPNPVKQH